MGFVWVGGWVGLGTWHEASFCGGAESNEEAFNQVELRRRIEGFGCVLREEGEVVEGLFGGGWVIGLGGGERGGWNEVLWGVGGWVGGWVEEEDRGLWVRAPRGRRGIGGPVWGWVG